MEPLYVVEKCSWNELNNGNTRSRKVVVGAREDGLLNSGQRGATRVFI